MPKMPKLPRLGSLFKGSQFGGSKLNQTQLLVLAGAFCFLLACVTFFLLPSGEQNNQQKAVPMTQVVVAKQDIPQRTVITESMLKVVDMPQDAVPSGAIVDMSDAIDKPANVPIQEGDILTDKKVVNDPRLAGFAGMIPPDCRAISVGITDITGIAGFAKPGDYVDVMTPARSCCRMFCYSASTRQQRAATCSPPTKKITRIKRTTRARASMPMPRRTPWPRLRWR